MARVAGGRVRTFTIGFHEQGYDEAQAARRVARHLGTDHTELYVTPAEARAVIPRLPEIYDEPFADSSQIPTFLVSQLARRHVTVALSGDGGDELFGGYARYAVGEFLWRKVRRIPALLRRGIGAFVDAAWPEELDVWAGRTLELLAPRLARRGSRFRLKRLAGVLKFRSFAELYEDLVSQWSGAWEAVRGARPGGVRAFADGSTRRSPLVAMTRIDLETYLPDDILVKVDRASMAVSLEVRTPFLDHRLVEWSLALPASLKVRDGVSKWLLRRVLYRHVPSGLVERPKMGFGVPMGEWLRGPLREWAEELLDPRRLRQQGFLEARRVHKEWSDHLARKADRHAGLWAVLMFQAWLERERRWGYGFPEGRA
jgi:asparagine synthase (glutamine-hydrolysing)